MTTERISHRPAGRKGEQQRRQRAQLVEYEAIRPATRFGALTLRFGLALIPARLAWLEDAMQELSR